MENTRSIGLRLDGSEALIRALDDHILTCELAKQLAREGDDLRNHITGLRLRYAELLHAQMEQFRADLAAAGWQEVRPSVWRSPAKAIHRGSEAAWCAMRRSRTGNEGQG